MVYQGSKNKLANDIVPIIQRCIDDNGVTFYFEPFVGGANVIDKIRCSKRTGADINGELVSLLSYMRDYPTLPNFPDFYPFEHYAEVREARKQERRAYAPWYTAGIGYFASYGGRYFDGGYGREGTEKRSIYRERLSNARKQAPNLKGITFIWSSYKGFSSNDFENAFIYCDPPYRGTKTYNGRDTMDYTHFYEWCSAFGENNFVLVSEYNMPSDCFTCVWEKERKVLQKSDRVEGETAVERLYTPKGGKFDIWFKGVHNA